ncbi:hypothetical protein ACHAW5_006440 [Stephanodiscus triporus]|uniref:Uncharacterized protein n=1 Tax=Stephanodiscus triporus TaxID=2934178 RepID=A0ABD3NHV6_9STRA
MVGFAFAVLDVRKWASCHSDELTLQVAKVSTKSGCMTQSNREVQKSKDERNLAYDPSTRVQWDSSAGVWLVGLGGQGGGWSDGHQPPGILIKLPSLGMATAFIAPIANGHCTFHRLPDDCCLSLSAVGHGAHFMPVLACRALPQQTTIDTGSVQIGPLRASIDRGWS